MTDCRLCSNYREERDVNFQDCDINADEKYWFTEEDCPYYEEIENV